ncbi:hypothetical protein PCASD_17532 [Puccinia coronata f. sp. avenae]|uniref:Homeobox domain-containing protein n=1 Tax=Puccinia coronata f. sp. avenae TaxID=200324 RepID=A0A2N5U3V7_9BASI|nr:hypothetical protein PCASD_17532 [Puccinia coronata f. sp. avenae]
MDLQSATLPLFQMLTMLEHQKREPTSDQDDCYSKLVASILNPTSSHSSYRRKKISNKKSDSTNSDSDSSSNHSSSVDVGLGLTLCTQISSSGVAPPPATKTTTRRYKPTPFNGKQTTSLLSLLRFSDTLCSSERELVGIVLGLSTLQVTRWFCNARARSLRRSKKYNDLEEKMKRNNGLSGRMNGPEPESTTSSTHVLTQKQHIDPRLMTSADSVNSSMSSSGSGCLEALGGWMRQGGPSAVEQVLNQAVVEVGNSRSSQSPPSSWCSPPSSWCSFDNLQSDDHLFEDWLSFL